MQLEDIPITAEIQAQIPNFSGEKRDQQIAKIKQLLKRENAVLVAHYYTHEDLQEIQCAQDQL